VDLDGLWESGKRLILVDVDNTLVQWRGEQFTPQVIGWIEKAKEKGFGICIISNTRRVERLERLKSILGVETVRGRFKPSRAMFRLDLLKFQRKASEAVMIGDQLMTDILGANRSGIDAIWVRRMEGREFVGTKVNRAIERLLTGAIYKALVLPEDRAPIKPGSPTTAELTIVQQISRFVIVGGSSFVIDTAISYLLMRWITVDGQPFGHVFGEWLRHTSPGLFGFANTDDKAAAPILGGIGSLVAMYNSFIWNRLWTFEARGKDAKSKQIARFYTVALTGALLNTILYSIFYNVIEFIPRHRILFSKAFAAALVAVWNFMGQRLFAFREKSE
jgi:HAD superfamily phosphatase (TIGR01668 family)